MAFIYIIGGLLCIMLSVYLLDKRDKMSHQIKIIQETRQDIEKCNQQLDDIVHQLNNFQEPLSHINHFSKKVLRYMK